MVDATFVHIPVLPNELIESLQVKDGDFVVDCTFGGGGHAAMVLERIGKNGMMLAIDRDMDAIEHGRGKFAAEIAAGRLSLHHGSFSTLTKALSGFTRRPQAIYADLGVSSHQLDSAHRGFSFQSDGPLDMRMNQHEGRSAAEVVNEASEQELVQLFFTFGEEPKSRHYARQIVARRGEKPFSTTKDLADFLASVSPYRTDSRKHPATKIFQALRMSVNAELSEVEALLRDGFNALGEGGRFAVITFHSLEDRLVKRAFNDFGGKATLDDIKLAQAGIHRERRAKGRIIKPYPASATDEEVRRNPRSRSAKLRVIEKREE